MTKELTTAQAIDNLAESTQEIANEIYHIHDQRCDFNGYTIADSMGLIAVSLSKIAEALENKGEGA